MQIRLFLLLILLCSSAYATAQADTAIVDTTLVRPAYSRDTLQVIHQIFAKKRGNAKYDTSAGLLTLGVGSATVVGVYAIVSVVAAAFKTKPDGGRVATFAVILLSPGSLMTGFGVAGSNRFSKKKEDAVTTAWQQGGAFTTKYKTPGEETVQVKTMVVQNHRAAAL